MLVSKELNPHFGTSLNAPDIDTTEVFFKDGI
jgi:hypothetical protein